MWSYHHILLDGWCHAILVEELEKIYDSLKNNKVLDLPEPIHFGSYVKWLEKKDASESKNYWKTYLKEYDHIAEIPKVVNRDFSALKNPHYKIKFSKQVSEKIALIVKDYNITQNDVFQTIWALLLAKYSNSNDVVYGNVVSGRPAELEGADRCLGLFINTIPVRFQYTKEQTLIELAKKSHEGFLEGMPHHYNSLAEIQNETNLKTDLIKHVIAFENYPLSEVNENEEVNQLFKISNVDAFDRTNYDLDVDIELAEEITVTFYYNANDYHPDYVKKIANSFDVLVHQFVQNPTKKINEISFVSKENIQELLHVFNKNAIDLNNTQPVNVLFENQTLVNTNKVSVIHNNKKWTYKELNTKANKIANTLLENGFKKGNFVGLHLKRSPELIAALLGIFKAGGVYVPLDTQNPTNRTLELLEEGEINALITDNNQLELLVEKNTFSDYLEQVLCINDTMKGQIDDLVLNSKDQIEKSSDKNPKNVNAITDWAYMLYTSGSTGKPKGAITRYDGAINHILAEFKALNLQDGFCFLQSASIASDISVWQILAPLLKGGSVLIANKEEVLDYKKTLYLMKEYNVTIAEFVPSYLIGLVDYILEQESQKNIVPTLQWMMMVGEEIPVKLVNNWLQLFPNCKVLNGYGPCEASDDITQYEITNKLPEHTLKVSIGKPIDNMNIFVLDDDEKLVPIGVTGEICVSGIGVGAGYFKEPEKTAESFKPNPFATTLGETMYKTGDLGRWLPDGNLEFLGRKDRQVKIRGNRVELGEIEAFIRENNFVENVAVVPYKKSSSNTSLIAFVMKEGNDFKPNFTQSFIENRERKIEEIQNKDALLKGKLMNFNNDVKMFSLNNSETAFVFNEIFTDQSYMQHGIELKPESVVFDVGANIGMFSVMVATCFPESNIYAFEPIPPTYNIMESNAKLYSSISNIHSYNSGLSNQSRTVTFTHYPKNSMLSGMYGDKNQDRDYIKNVIEQRLITNQKQLDEKVNDLIEDLTKDALVSEDYECQLLTFSDVIEEHNLDRVDLLKIDVERSEKDVLDGIKEGDWNKIQQIVIEVHNDGDSLKEIELLLKEKGFNCVVEQEKLLKGTDLYNIYASRKDKDDKENRKEGEGIEATLLEKCAKGLPYYMQPTEYCFVDKIPQNLSDKVDDKKLIAIYNEQANENIQVTQASTPCITETEKTLKIIWEQILQKTTIGAGDDFFEKGGHSLLAMRVKAAVLKKMKIDLDIRDLFVYTKLNNLAEHIDKKATFNEDDHVISVQEKPEKIPLSFAQESLWFIDNLQGNTTEYNISATIKLKGYLDITLLEHSIKSIIERHETLRSIVKSEGGIPYLNFLNADNWNLNVFSIDTAENNEAYTIEKLISESFNLAIDFKLKAYLLQTETQENILVLVMHHIASDGWSESILVDELITFYNAGINNTPIDLPKLTIQYSDYILWQKKNKHKLEDQISYWKEKLNNAAILNFPTDFERPKVQDTQGDSVDILIDEELLTKLKELSITNGVTLYMTLLAAYKILLYKYAGQKDICVGTPIAGRTNQEIEKLIGYFVNTLTIRSFVNPEIKFNDFLKQIKTTALDAYKNQDAPFEKVVEALVKKRDLSRNPLYQVMFTLQNIPELEEISLGSLDMEFITSDFLQVQADLHFLLEENQDKKELKLEIEYRKSLFNKTTIKRLGVHYKQLLNAIVASPSKLVGKLEILNEEEKNQLVKTFNYSDFKFSKEETIVDVFNLQVIKQPNEVALIHNTETLTYKELNNRANQVAHYLINAGIKKGDLVPICMERSILTVISIFGIIKSGAAYVPIDQTNPLDRISFIIKDSSAKLVVTNLAIIKKIQNCTNINCIAIDGITEKLEILPLENPKNGITQNDLSYVIYTSGTTGLPKGAVMQHKSLISFVEFINQTHPLSLGDKMTFKTNYGFDMAIPEIFGWIKGGASMVIIADEDVKDLNKFLKVLEEQKVTQLNLVPSHLSVFLEYVLANNIKLPFLKYFIVGGEALSIKTVRAYQKSLLTASLDNIYGPTETCVFSTFSTVSKMSEEEQIVSIGKPTPNAQIYIVSEELELLPIGVVGELCIGGLGLGKGYLNREELTSTKFIENPYKIGERLYKTGDLAKWSDNGTINYIGRKDSQVKINGYRIELGEVESILNQCSNVKQGVVVVKNLENLGKQLIAYVTTLEKSEVNSNLLQEEMLTKLPEYMVPKTVAILNNFPLNHNGKIDRKSLSETYTLKETALKLVEEQTAMELLLVKVWENLLGISSVSINDNFFELGGHSILAMRAIFEIQKELNIAVDVKLLFLNPTIQQLAKELETIDTANEYQKIAKIEEAKFYETSQAQKRIWLAEQVENNRAVYNIAMAFQMKGDVILEKLKRAINYVITKHEILRTNFIGIDGIPYQKIQPCKKEQADFKIINTTDALQTAKTILLEEENYEFNLELDTLIRFRLISNDKESFFIVNLHHIIGDGWSIQTLHEDVLKAYEQIKLTDSLPIENLSIQYKDYAFWHNNQLKKENLKIEEYWLNALSGVEKRLEIPLDKTRGINRDTMSNTLEFSLEKELSLKIKEISSTLGIRKFIVLQALLKSYLAQYMNTTDVVLGTPVAGRNHSQLQDQIGCYINVLALRSQILNEKTFIEILKQVNIETEEALKNDSYPYDVLVNKLVLDRQSTRNPLFDILISYDESNDLESISSLEFIELKHENIFDNHNKYDITYAFQVEKSGEITIAVKYLTSLFYDSTITAMKDQIITWFQLVLSNPNESLKNNTQSITKEVDLVDDFI